MNDSYDVCPFKGKWSLGPLFNHDHVNPNIKTEWSVTDHGLEAPMSAIRSIKKDE